MIDSLRQWDVPGDRDTDIPYGTQADGLALTLTIFADRDHLRAELAEDARAAGLRVTRRADLASLTGGEALPVGDVIFADCPAADAHVLAALSRLDMRAAHSGAEVIVMTTVAALDAVFACLDQSSVQIVVAASRAERFLALGRAIASLSARRLRDLSDEDRLTLLRLTEQVGQIAQRLDRIAMSAPVNAGLPDARLPDSRAANPGVVNDRRDDGGFMFESPRRGFSGKDGEGGSDRLVRTSKPPMPDPRLVRRIIRQRQARARHFDAVLFADPAWDMLLDLTAARAEHVRVSVTSLCIASGVPPTTALRWISQMIDQGLFVRVEDEIDRRRAFIALTDAAAEGMARYFAELGSAAGKLV